MTDYVKHDRKMRISIFSAPSTIIKFFCTIVVQMDLENIKMDWAPILESYISSLEGLYPDVPVRESFKQVIESLNNNELKSRVILSGVNVAGYAYIIESREKTDRLYGSVGFIEEKYCTEDRLGNLIDWLSAEAKKSNKYIMINEVFNGKDAASKVLRDKGFKRIVREKMELDLNSFMEEKRSYPDYVQASGINNLKVKEFSRAEYSAYQDSGDIILFPSESEDERVNMTNSIFKGQYGKVIPEASIILRKDGEIVGAVIATDGNKPGSQGIPIIADIFVSRELRGKGLGKALIINSLLVLKSLSHHRVQLSVNSDSIAKKLYESMGFAESEYAKEIIFYKKP